jgi:hypothetical protein
VRLLAFSGLFLSLALAAPEEVAREAVARWLKGELSPKLEEVLKAPPEEAPKLLERYALFPPPPKGLSVNLEAARVEGNRVAFPAALGEEVGEVVVVLQGERVRRILFRPEGLGLPAYLLTPLAGWGFVLLSLFWTWLLFQTSPFRAWLLEALALVRAHKGLYLFTNLFLYGLFALGALLAYGMPELARAMQVLFAGALEAIGLEKALGQGLPVLAGVIFHWNFSQGLFLTGLVPALFLGLPVLLLNALRYFAFPPWRAFPWPPGTYRPPRAFSLRRGRSSPQARSWPASRAARWPPSPAPTTPRRWPAFCPPPAWRRGLRALPKGSRSSLAGPPSGSTPAGTLGGWS